MADRAKLHERLASLTKPPVQDPVPAIPPVTAPVSPARAKLQELKGGAAATQAGAATAPERTETKPPIQHAVPATPAMSVEPVTAAATPAVTAVPIVAAAKSAVTAKAVAAAAPISRAPTPSERPERRRRRRFGFLLFFAGLIAVFFMVRAIPPDWEIGPFRIDVTGNAADSPSLYFADDPRAPFWLLVPTFNLPPRFFAARPNSSSRPIVALAPSTPSPTRQHSPRTARSKSSSCVSAKSVTPKTTASKKVTSVSTAVRRTAIACCAMLASLAEALAPAAACPKRTMLAIPVAIYARNVNPASRAFVVRVMGFLLKRGLGFDLEEHTMGKVPEFHVRSLVAPLKGSPNTRHSIANKLRPENTGPVAESPEQPLMLDS